MTMTDSKSEQLAHDVSALDRAARNLMDSITGNWACEGELYVPEIAQAAQTILASVLGRLSHTLTKASAEISNRAADCYIDRLGSTTEATEEIREIAAGLNRAAEMLGTVARGFARDGVTGKLGTIGERD